MDNFSVFNQESLARSIEPFLPGATPHIVPVTYMAWTPDVFLFMFRTTYQRNQEHFFIVVTFDYLRNGQESAAAIIKQWVGIEVIEFLKTSQNVNDSEDSVQADTNGIYRSYLARVEKPLNINYWGDAITVTKDSNVDEVLSDFTSDQRATVKKLMADRKMEKVKVHKSRTEEGMLELFSN
jgi:hypothetical protein